MRTLVVILILVAFIPLIARDPKVVHQFQKVSGYPKGRAGYVVDHRIPLCAGGTDTVENMRWQPVRESYVKDRYERLLCAELKRQGYVLRKQ